MGIRIIKSSQFKQWHRLDNSAKIFPAASTLSAANVFRLACVLKEPVDPRLLQQALVDTLPRFPAFAVRMRAGMFWYYFEPNTVVPTAEHEELNPCAPMNRKENGGYLFRVLYHGTRISLETYHALTDGTGAMEFLQGLVSDYLRLAHPDAGDVGQPYVQPEPPNAGELTDSYREIYKKTKGYRPEARKAFYLKGTALPYTVVKVTHGITDTSALLALARERQTTVTTLLCAVLIYSIYTARLNGQASPYPVQISLPVNLRGVFGNRTALNFFECVNIGMLFDCDSHTFEDVLDEVKKQLAARLEKDNLMAQNAYKVGFSRVLALRLVPLFIKNLVLGAIYRRGELTASTTLSNLGRVTMPQPLREWIQRFEFILSPTNENHIKCAVCSFDEQLVITFSSSIEQSDVQCAFFRMLTELGLPVTVETNYLYDQRQRPIRVKSRPFAGPADCGRQQA